MSGMHADQSGRETAARKRGKEQGLLVQKPQQEGSRPDVQKDFLPGKVPALPLEGEEGAPGWPAGLGQT